MALLRRRPGSGRGLRAAVAPAALATSLLLAVAGPGQAGGSRGLRPTALQPADVLVVAAGDVAESGGQQQATGDLIRSVAPAAVLPLGDEAYEDGTLGEFMTYYDPAWGSFDSIADPTPGNHEYHTSGATGYFDYFGARAPAPYYSFDLGSWHLISLNSEISHDSGSAQETWLQNDLVAHRGACTLAYWHRPRFDSGTTHGSDTSMAPFWNDLYAAHADVVLSAHEHHYERFALQTPGGVANPNGVREFVVGTGGAALYDDFGTPLGTSEVRDGVHWGVLELTLRDGGYDWAFVSTTAGRLDSGTSTCHGASPPGPPPPPPPPSPPPPPHVAHCVVPAVTGMTLRRAKARVRSRHCSVGRIERKRSKRVGRVLAQRPKRGSVERRGFPVRLTVGRR